MSTDKRSGITNDPNRSDDPKSIVRLLAQTIAVDLKTVKVVEGLPSLKACGNTLDKKLAVRSAQA